jgi:hypothetical protein
LAVEARLVGWGLSLPVGASLFALARQPRPGPEAGAVRIRVGRQAARTRWSPVAADPELVRTAP